MTIKNASPDDAEKLAILFDQYRTFYHMPSDMIGGEKFLRDRLIRNESVVFISFAPDGIMTGFTQLYPLFSSTRMKRLWLLNDLFVLPTYRNLGISVELINKAKELCRATDACGISLETAISNTIGNSLYPKTGFVLDKEHHYYFWNAV